MKRSDFNKLIGSTFKQIQHLSDNKGAEYSGDDDALANFKRNAERIGLDPLQVWHVYAAKHYDSLCSYIKEINAPARRVLTEPIDGRVDDLITYLLLFKALVKEKEDEHTKAIANIR
jgi:hypothetical protein